MKKKKKKLRRNTIQKETKRITTQQTSISTQAKKLKKHKTRENETNTDIKSAPRQKSPTPAHIRL
jgi:hypothetical protein